MTRKVSKLFVALMALGVIISICGLAMIGFDVRKLGSHEPYEDKHYDAQELNTSLVVEDEDVDFEILPSTDEYMHFDYSENSEEYYEITESNNTLSIIKKTSYDWTDYILNWNYESIELIVYVPAGVNVTASIDISNGDIDISNIKATSIIAETENGHVDLENVNVINDVELDSENGKIVLTDVTAKSILGETSNGGVKLENVITSGNTTVSTKNGSISCTEVDSLNFKGTTSNGKITFKNVTAIEEVYGKTSNNSISIEAVSVGTRLYLKSGNGSISGTVIGSLEDFSFDCDTDNGSCNLPTNLGNGSKKMEISTNNGSIKITFIE